MYATLTATGPVIRTITSPVVCWVLHTLSTQSAVQICIMEKSQSKVFLTKFSVEETRKLLQAADGKRLTIEAAPTLD